MRLVFPEVRLTAVRIVWQPPEEPNGVILGKEPWWGGGSGGQGELSSPVSVDNGGGHRSRQQRLLDTEHHGTLLFLQNKKCRALRRSRGMKFTFC